MEKQFALLIDVKQCIGCQSCEQACKTLHHYPMEHEAELSYTALTVVQEKGGRNVRRMCMHCQDPTCASACPVGALKKNSFGPVTYDADKCIGCRYCMVACPYSVPRYEWTKLAPFVKKCDMCAERVKQGMKTACAEACPVGATVFGTRSEILAEAWKRLRDDPAYVQRIYGTEELGGTSVFYVSDVDFEKIGFKATAKDAEPLRTLTATAMGDAPTVVMVGGSILAGLYWITQRRKEVALVEAQEREANTNKGGR
jgi:formate dehydrogenase iron-sulfur subunit